MISQPVVPPVRGGRAPGGGLRKEQVEPLQCVSPALRNSIVQTSCAYDGYVSRDQVLNDGQRAERLLMSKQTRQLADAPLVCPEVGR